MQPTLPASWAGHESVLRPSSPSAHDVSKLFTFMTTVSVLVYVVVVGAMLYAAWRAHRSDATADSQTSARLRSGVTAATIATTIILFAYLAYDFGVGRAAAAPVRDPGALRISLVGHQWWWEVHYRDTAPQRLVVTANEIHVPVGRPVLFSLSSTDVIHSFWIPNLTGKRDLVPGHNNDAWFQADTPGVYRGQCAEFCGLQHANMAVIIIAESPERYTAWYQSQLASATDPADPERKAGQRVFLSGPCAMCHSIAGTSAGATLGPDLTHVGSRLTIAAGVLANNRANLASWIADPQGIKPGSNMPATQLSRRDLDALVTYLEGLK